MTIKGVLGCALLLVYGFMVFITCASLGFVGTQLLTTMSLWHIVGGTSLGTIAVVLHYILKWGVEESKK